MGVLHHPPLLMDGHFQKTRLAQKSEEAANHRFNNIFYGYVDIQQACHGGRRSPTDRCVRCAILYPWAFGGAQRPSPQKQGGLGEAGREDPAHSTITWERHGEDPAPRNKDWERQGAKTRPQAQELRRGRAKTQPPGTRTGRGTAPRPSPKDQK